MKKHNPHESNSERHNERLRSLAYQIWEEEGRPEGRSEAHWFAACEMLADELEKASEPLPNWLNKNEVEKERKEKSTLTEVRQKSAA